MSKLDWERPRKERLRKNGIDRLVGMGEERPPAKWIKYRDKWAILAAEDALIASGVEVTVRNKQGKETRVVVGQLLDHGESGQVWEIKYRR